MLEQREQSRGLQPETITEIANVQIRLAALPEPMQKVLADFYLRVADSVIAQNMNINLNVPGRRVKWYEERFTELLDGRWLNVHAEKVLPPDQP